MNVNQYLASRCTIEIYDPSKYEERQICRRHSIISGLLYCTCRRWRVRACANFVLKGRVCEYIGTWELCIAISSACYK